MPSIVDISAECGMPNGMRLLSNSLMQLYAAIWKAKAYQCLLYGISMISLQKYVSVLGSTATGILVFESLCYTINIVGLWVYAFNHCTLLLETSGFQPNYDFSTVSS